MADEKLPGKKEDPEWFKNSPFKNHIEANAKRDPQFYYNFGVYVMLYNRIKGDLMNKKPSGESSAFDTEINDIIRDGLSGDQAHVEAFLDKYGVKGVLATYDLTDPVQAQAAKDNPNSSVNFVRKFDNIVSFARDAARAKYTSPDKKQMLTYDDAREILRMKEYRADKPYEKVRLLVDNQDFDENGYQKDGPLLKAFKNAEQKLENINKKIRRNRWKAFGYALGTAAMAVATVTIGIPAFAGGGGLLAGFFGNLYASSAFAGGLVGIGATVGGVAGAFGLGGRFIGKLGQIWKDRKKYKDFLHSREKYGDANVNDFENMGYARIKEKYYEAVALKKFYENYAKGKIFYHGKMMSLDEVKSTMSPEKWEKFKSRLQPWDYLEESELKSAIISYLNNQKELPNGKDAKRLFKDAGYHAFVADRNLQRDSKQFGFYKLYDFMNEGVELYETSNLSPDEMLLNYGVNGPSARLSAEKVKAGGVSYVAEQLEEFTASRESFAKVGKIGDYKAHLGKFGTTLSEAFNISLFENAYTAYSINEANRIATTNKAVKEFFDEDGKTIGSHVASMYSFINSEQKNTSRNPLSEEVEVGLQYQLDFSESSMIAGCKQLGDESAEASEAAQKIAEMDSCEYIMAGGAVSAQLPAEVENAISSVTNADTRRYLQHMAESKLKATKTTTIPHFAVDSESATSTNSIAYRINNLTDTSKADEIRAAIENQFTGGSSDAEREEAKRQAYSMLNRQISAIENKKRDDARTKAMYGVKAGSTAFADIMKEISEIEGLDPNKLFTLKNDKILKISPAECRDYLMFKLKDKVCKNMKAFAENKDNFNSDNFGNIRGFLSNLFLFTQSGYIDAWQRDEILGYLNKERVIPAFETFLKDAELGFFTDAQRDNVSKVRNFLETTLSSGTGFKEYLDMDNPESKAIKARLERIYNSTFNLRQLVTSSKNVEDPDSPELQAFLKVYFEQDRPADNKLLKLLTKLKDVSGKIIDINNLELTTAEGSPVDLFDGTGTKTYTPTELTGSFVYAINDQLNKFTGTGGIHVDLNEKDSMAALIIIKRRVLAKMKEHLAVLRQKHGANFGTWLATADGATYINNMKKQWLKVANLIDAKIFDLLNNYDFDPSYAASNDTASIVNAQFLSATAIQEYVDSKGLGMS